eukprot:TRINITY_DN58_c0_g2_i2.p1 TRINITY_DN58_c0_g2~~TRINITY_DN58_c0_g2_i2.p1  ORF type:complete len:131 (-),score=47.49 TRINITY_DN58_c0_g2_i2:105-497(-)
MCIRDRYQRRVHGDNKIHTFQSSTLSQIPRMRFLALVLLAIFALYAYAQVDSCYAHMNDRAGCLKLKCCWTETRVKGYDIKGNACFMNPTAMTTYKYDYCQTAKNALAASNAASEIADCACNEQNRPLGL